MKPTYDLAHELVDLTDHVLMLTGLVRGLVEAQVYNRSRKLTQAGILWDLARNDNHAREMRMSIFGATGRPMSNDPERLAHYIHEIQLYVFGELINTFPEAHCKACGKQLSVSTHQESGDVEFCNFCDDFYCHDCMIEHERDENAHRD
jgi:hypothetical protein